MLFTYNYVNHTIEKMHEYIEYIFYEVWCKAHEVEYDISVYDQNSDLKDVIQDLYHTELKGSDFFLGGIQEIFYIFKKLDLEQINQLKSLFQYNNDIENLCNNYYTVVTYKDIKNMNEELESALKKFFMGLYSNDFLSLKAISSKIGTISEHYNEFVKTNSTGKCPFCGLQPMDTEYVRTREAYDHYLPKSKYPFSSINFKNLAPICNKCNSGNKSSKDPLTDSIGNRRKAFYPYNTNPFSVDIKIELKKSDIENLTPEDMTITLSSIGYNEEVKTWDKLFNIEERYKAELCSTDAKYWVTQIIDECDIDRNVFLTSKLKNARRFPFLEKNFLLKPFLEACEMKGVFDI